MSEVSNVEVGEVKGLNYWERHIGDYAKETRHLSLLEHGVYTILLDYCFGSGRAIPHVQAYRYATARTRAEKRAVDAVLAEFFILKAGMYFSKLVMAYLDAKDKRAQTSKENGKLGGRPAKKTGEMDEPNDNNRLENEKPNQNLKQTYQEPNPNLKKPVPIANNPIANNPLSNNSNSNSIALPVGSAKKTGAAREYRAEFTLPEWDKASPDNDIAAKATDASPASASQRPAAATVQAAPHFADRAVDAEIDCAAVWEKLTAPQRHAVAQRLGALEPEGWAITEWEQFPEEARQHLIRALHAFRQHPAHSNDQTTAVAEPYLAKPAVSLKTEPLADPNGAKNDLEAPPVRENGTDKGIIHEDPKPAKMEVLETVCEKPAQATPAVAQAETVNESGKSRKKELTQEQKNLNATIWQRYQAAYVERYGVNPMRNKKVNGQISDLRERLGHEAPDVAAFYVGINDNWLIRASHNIGTLLQGCEGYRTQWATGRQVNSVTARQMENTQANMEAAKDAVQILKTGWVNPIDALMALGDKPINALEAQT